MYAYARSLAAPLLLLAGLACHPAQSQSVAAPEPAGASRADGRATPSKSRPQGSRYWLLSGIRLHECLPCLTFSSIGSVPPRSVS
jgi:hypothetical protein